MINLERVGLSYYQGTKHREQTRDRDKKSASRGAPNLTDQQRAQIVKLRRAENTMDDIARTIGCSRRTVRRALKREGVR